MTQAVSEQVHEKPDDGPETDDDCRAAVIGSIPERDAGAGHDDEHRAEQHGGNRFDDPSGDHRLTVCQGEGECCHGPE